MAHHQKQHHRTTSSMDAQLTDMINELYNAEQVMQTGTFVPMTQPNSPIQFFNTSSTTVSSMPASASSSPSISNKQNRTATTSTTSAPTPCRRDDETHNIVQEKYHCRTLGSHNINRMTILPIFPCTNVRIETMTTTTPKTFISAKPTHLLLCNVPINLLSSEQYARIRRGAFLQLFRLEINSDSATAAANTTNSKDSFLLSFYEDLYVKLKKRLKVDIPLLDFNLTRLRQCINQVVDNYHLKQTMLNLDELSVALEFYLQIDVDMFFLKTCSFNGVEPRLFEQRYREGLFCLDTPMARFTITPCQKSSCLYCQSLGSRHYLSTTTTTTTTTVIPFSRPHIHRFVNQYEAILNCPATCESRNCIYVLTCPCGQFDFIGESPVSFVETLAMHREEGNRIIREFLIGEQNVEHTTHGLKSDKKKMNDELWLYQHSARCSVALQLFLDYNPEYWCFVPMKTAIERQQLHHPIVRGYLSAGRTTPNCDSETLFESDDSSTSWTRKDAEVRLLVENVPTPPFGYIFNNYQRQQQANFFKWTQDRNVPLHNVDVYNANIIAILPDNASKLFRKLIESLLITHADCKLNQTGHLLRSYQSNANPNRSLTNIWCVNLTRRPSFSSAAPFPF